MHYQTDAKTVRVGSVTLSQQEETLGRNSSLQVHIETPQIGK